MPSLQNDVWTPNMRQQALLDEVRSRGAVSVERLAQRLDVTMQTVRRDVQRLSEAGLLSRFHGGVSLPAPPPGQRTAPPGLCWQERQALRAEAKARIAKSVAAAIPDGARVMLGIGTTVEALARALHHKKGLHVITHSLPAALGLVNHPDCTVEVPGGVLRQRDGALEGESTQALLRQTHADILVVSTLGVSAQGQLQGSDRSETASLHIMLERSQQHWLVADTSKFSQMAQTAPSPPTLDLQNIHRVFTEGLPPAPLFLLMKALGISLTIAS